MNSKKLILAASLLVNCLLIATVIRHFNQPSSVVTSVSEAANLVPTSDIAPIAPVKSEVEINPSGTNAQVTTLDWQKDLKSSDLSVYIQNLRAFGTPDARIREIIWGELEAIYRPRRAALRPKTIPAEQEKFWQQQNRWFSNLPSRENAEALRLLQKEENDLFKKLMGKDSRDLMIVDIAGTNWMAGQLSYLPQEVRNDVMEIEARFQDEKSAIYAKNRNFYEFAQEDIRKLEKKYEGELSKILTPDQLTEWKLRNSQTAETMKNNDLSVFDPSEDEFRALVKYKQTLEEMNPSSWDGDAPPLTKEERKAFDEKNKAMKAELEQTLGTNRVREFTLEQDYGYRNLIEGGAPKDSVFQLDDMKNQAQAAAQKIRKDKTLTPEQRNDALAAIQNETKTSVNQLLGDKLSKNYVNQGGWWLNTLAPPRPVKTVEATR